MLRLSVQLHDDGQAESESGKWGGGGGSSGNCLPI
jgi:hypothetical protein